MNASLKLDSCLLCLCLHLLPIRCHVLMPGMGTVPCRSGPGGGWRCLADNLGQPPEYDQLCAPLAAGSSRCDVGDWRRPLRPLLQLLQLVVLVLVLPRGVGCCCCCGWSAVATASAAAAARWLPLREDTTSSSSSMQLHHQAALVEI